MIGLWNIYRRYFKITTDNEIIVQDYDPETDKDCVVHGYYKVPKAYIHYNDHGDNDESHDRNDDDH